MAHLFAALIATGTETLAVGRWPVAQEAALWGRSVEAATLGRYDGVVRLVDRAAAVPVALRGESCG